MRAAGAPYCAGHCAVQQEVAVQTSQRAKAARERAGLTQREAAKRAGTAEQIISRIERGTKPVTQVWARRLAAAYRCKASDIDPTILDADELLFLEEYRRLAPKIRPDAYRLLREWRLSHEPERAATAPLFRLLTELSHNIAAVLALMEDALRKPDAPPSDDPPEDKAG